MGYTAERLRGEPFRIADTKQLIDRLKTEEESLPYGHYSWCESVESYIEESKVTYTEPEQANAHALSAILENYGFITEVTGDSLIIENWGGDKIGSTWVEIWDALASAVTDRVEWIMRGEDNTLWACVISGGYFTEYDVVTTFRTDKVGE
jgi:hypothetical protein